jgi:thiamine monophosphate kinase
MYEWALKHVYSHCFFNFSLLIVIFLLRIHLSLTVDVSDGLYHAAHYHTIRLQVWIFISVAALDWLQSKEVFLSSSLHCEHSS